MTKKKYKNKIKNKNKCIVAHYNTAVIYSVILLFESGTNAYRVCNYWVPTAYRCL